MADKAWVCIASGPSLTAEDCALVQRSWHRTIAVNSSWKMARFADVIYAGDPGWWDAYGAEIDIPAERWTFNQNTAQAHGIKHHGTGSSILNSGLRAIELAVHFGASRILLLGYDCSVDRGAHWHGDHDKTKNPDGKQCVRWQNQFAQFAGSTKVEVINCSRETALTCFPRMSLEDALC